MLGWDKTRPGPSGPEIAQARPQKQKCALSGRASGNYEEAAVGSQEQRGLFISARRPVEP
jgi:hypothetical protein